MTKITLFCKFCELPVENRTLDNPVDLYIYEGEVVACCVDCRMEKLDRNKIMLLDIPKGWTIIDDAALDKYLEQKQALIDVNEEIRKAEGLPEIDTYYAHPAGKLKMTLTRLRASIEMFEKQMHSIGLSGDQRDMLSGAYCPACKGPLIKMVGIKDKHALFCASSKLVEMMKPTRAERNRKVLACLQCGTAYIGNRKKK